MMTIPELFLLVASYVFVAGIGAWAGVKAGCEIMRRYWRELR